MFHDLLPHQFRTTFATIRGVNQTDLIFQSPDVDADDGYTSTEVVSYHIMQQIDLVDLSTVCDFLRLSAKMGEYVRLFGVRST